ncbi:MAG: tetratricopeptide repeat protein [Candidatus Zixiibacteriota bacterium]
MSRCSDKRYGDLLHAYEIGMLSEDDRRAFELHLFDCQHCFEQAQRFQDTAELMRYDPDVWAVPSEAERESSRISAELSERKISLSREKVWRAFIPTVVAALIIILLVLKPWQFDIRPSQEAVAAQNRLAVLYFDNLAAPGDPQSLGQIVTSLVIADLAESHYLQVVSSQRLYDILRLQGDDNSKLSDKKTAVRVADKAGARWMITGSILQIEPQLILTAQIIEVATGDLLASPRVDGKNGENVFALVDKLTVQVKNDLSLPSAARREPDRQVAEVTTHSQLAYRYYLEGVVNYNRYFNTEAVESFKKALEIDSTFAMVYYFLSLIDDPTLIDKAVAYVDRAPRKEGFYIRSQKAYLTGDIDRAIRELQESLEYYSDDKEACFRIGLCYAKKLEFDKAIQYYKMATEIDPLYKIVYNQMAYTYDWMGDFDSSLAAIDMYISLAPDEPNPYDSRGDILTANDHLEEALESYLKALEIKPDFWTSLFKVGKNNLLLGRFAVADSCFGELARCDDPSWRAAGLAALAYVPLLEGKFDKAIGIINDGLAAVGDNAYGRDIAHFHYLKAIVLEEKGELNEVLKEYEASVRQYRRQLPDDVRYNQHFLAQFLARTGEIDSAQKIIENYREIIETERDTLRCSFAAATVAHARGNLNEAITQFELAARDMVIPYTPAIYLLAQVYFEAGRWADGITELKKLEVDFTDTKLYYGSWVVKANYYLGLAYEQLSQDDLAVEQYRLFIDLWKDADSGITELDDARSRLSRLTGKS